MKKYKGLVPMAIIALQIFSAVFFDRAAYGAQAPGSGGKEVVFLLDASGSMKTNDPQRLAMDSVAQLAYTLPTNYRVGVVAYNEEVVLAERPVEDSRRESLMAMAQDISYRDYSNAGAGLSKAVELLLPQGGEDKTVIMVSDGEILLSGAEASAQSIVEYERAVRLAAEEGIKIHVIGLGPEMEHTEDSIFMAARQTGGSIYHRPQAAGIQSAVDSILNEELQIKQTTVAIVDTDGTIESIPIELPFAHASKVRVLLSGSGTIENLNANFQAGSAKQIHGERYSLMELDGPKSDRMDLSFSSSPGSRIRVTVIPEYRVVPRYEVTYEDRIPEGEDEAYYRREAAVTYRFYDAANPNLQLWTESYFDNSPLPVRMGDASYETALQKGALSIEEEVKDGGLKQAVFDYSRLSVNVWGTGELSVELAGPPELPPVEPEPPYVIYGLCALTVLALGAFLFLALRPKPAPGPQDDKPEPGKYSYGGKLNIYITRAPSGYDIPPLSFNLFRLPSTKVIALEEVLESCGVKERFEGAQRIYFKAGQGRSLILTNNSDCTIMKSREILMKKKSYQLLPDAKADITFEDEISELTLQYKDLKPSEM